MIRPAILALALAQSAAPALANPLASSLADLAAIDLAVAGFTGAAPGAAGGAASPVDRRLRLAACRLPLALGWYGAQRDSVQVACPGPGGWRIFVPLAGVGRADLAAPVIARGDAVSITVSGGGFAVSQPGEALEGGAVGAWIKVRSLNPKAQPLRARVIRPGVVGMDLP